MKLLRQHWMLLGIVILATFLRLWQLGAVPISPDWDEAALGYNAYSILKTGKDEYGTFLPLTIRSFDDYKPPLYVYLAIPSVALFGLTTWAVRLPSVVAGVAAVVGVYFLTRLLFWDPSAQQKYKDQNCLALIAAFLLAISPWHIQFSRIAFEANIGVTLNIWAVVCFLKGLSSRRWFLVSAILFALGPYSYHSERIFVPLLVVALAIIYRNALWQIKRSIALGIIVGLVVIAPLVPIFFQKNTLTRLRGTSSLADQTGLLAKSVAKLQDDQSTGNPLGIVFDNRRLVWLKTIADGYLSHYSLRWWFLTGDNPRHHAPGMGLLYLWELPFLLYGIYSVARRGGRARAVLLSWFFMAPIAASPTTELPHAIRTLVFLPTFQIFTAVGVSEIWQRAHIQKNLALKIGSALFLFFAASNVVYYLHMYFGHMNHEVSEFWQYGYKEAVQYAQSQGSKYKKIVVSTKLEQPHMFFLYYLKYDPTAYLAAGGTASGGFAEVRNQFDRYEFRPISWDKEIRDGSILYIGTPKEIDTANLTTIHYLDGTDAMKITDR